MVTSLLLLTMGLKAQNEVGEWSLKPHVGVNTSSMTNMPNIPLSGDITLKKDFLLGFEAGVEAEYQLTDRFSMSAGLNYALQGGKWKDFVRPGIEIKKTKLQMGYIQLPIMANYYLTEGLALKAGVQFGLTIHAHIKSKLWGNTSSGTVSEDVDEDVMKYFNKLDISIPFGVSFEFENNMVLDVRYKLGLSIVDKSDEDSRGSMRNRVFTISFGYKFDL